MPGRCVPSDLPAAQIYRDRAAILRAEGEVDGELHPDLVDLQADASAWLHGIGAATELPECDARLALGITLLLRQGNAGDYVLACALTDRLLVSWPAIKDQPAHASACLHFLSWYFTNNNDPGVDRVVDNPGSARVHVVADLCRAARDPHQHPHGLLALRGSGLDHSKRNFYTSAWLTFGELRGRLTHFERSYGETPLPPELRQMFLEVQQQAMLAETGTAARTVERTLERWSRDVEPRSPRTHRLAFHEAFTVLRRGTLTGNLATDGLGQIALSGARTLTKLGISSWARRPGVMTARCHLELIPLCRVLQTFGTRTPPDASTWSEQIVYHWRGFTDHYVQANTNPLVTLDKDHIRELLQLRLHAALLFPRASVPPCEPRDRIAVPDCLQIEAPDKQDIADTLTGLGADANVALSISSPAYLAWMQRLSRDDELILWMTDVAQWDLKRRAVRASFSQEELGWLRQASVARFDESLTRWSGDEYSSPDLAP